MEINVGDDITMNGIITQVLKDDWVEIKTVTDRAILIRVSEINTIHPVYKTDGIDHRKGN